MNDHPFLWFALGAFSVVAALFAIRLARFLTTSDRGGAHEPSAEFPVDVSNREPPARLAGDVPFQVDNRPMPAGDDIDRLLPVRVGSYRREPLRVPRDIHSDPIYANYTAGRSRVFVELGICGAPAGAQMAIDTARRETLAEFPDVAQVASIGTDPSYFKVTTTSGAFLAWTRGGYYFSVHAKDGDNDLDEFMEAFPF